MTHSAGGFYVHPCPIVVIKREGMRRLEAQGKREVDGEMGD